MTELKQKAIKMLNNFPEEHVAEVIDFMAAVEAKKVKDLEKSRAAWELIKKYRGKIPSENSPEDGDWKNLHRTEIYEKYVA